MATSYPNHDIGAACKNAHNAFTALAALSPESRAEILDSIALALDARREDILNTCADETALTIDELIPEFARMTGTLRMFAALVREGSWVRAAIDTPALLSPGDNAGVSGTAEAQHAQHSPSPHAASLHASPGPGGTAGAQHVIGPNHDIRSLLVPLGPVAVFGSSNFPLAYGVCGGDTASALAAGCPVIIKEHAAHPITGRLLANIAQQAIAQAFDESEAQARIPASANPSLPHLLQYLRNEDHTDFAIARGLVQHPSIAAVGFTGSVPGGLAIEQLARDRTIPIPVFAEVGSLNAIVISSISMFRRGIEVAHIIADSVLARAGQQCTKPGVVFVPFAFSNYDDGSGSDSDIEHRVLEVLGDRLKQAQPRRLLAPWIAESYERRLSQCIATGKAWQTRASNAAKGAPCLLTTHTSGFRHHSTLRDEIFGPALLVVDLTEGGFGHGEADLPDLLRQLPGALTLTVFDEPDGWLGTEIAKSVNAGRIILNGPPTGVRVATSMVHGGPFPATNAPHTTAVGPRAIERWCRPVCYQNCPDGLLPPELQNANPRGVWRTVNGELTKSAIR